MISRSPRSSLLLYSNKVLVQKCIALITHPANHHSILVCPGETYLFSHVINYDQISYRVQYTCYCHSLAIYVYYNVMYEEIYSPPYLLARSNL